MAVLNIAEANSSLVQYGGHYYKRYDQSMGWHQAKAFCEKKGGNLVVVTSSGEQTFVANLASLSPYQEAWLGATDEVTEGVWRWVTNEPLNYSNWKPAQPDNAQYTTNSGLPFDEDYLHIVVGNGYKWNDIPTINAASSFGQTSTICEWAF